MSNRSHFFAVSCFICVGCLGPIVAQGYWEAMVQEQDQADSGKKSDDKYFLEKSRVIHVWDGETAGDQFGWTARKTGDLDGDQAFDFVATAPTYQQNHGKIYVYSSRSGKLLFSKTGRAGERFGNSATSAGDVNKDGVDDIVVGAPNGKNPGNAYVYSGKSHERLLSFKGKKAGDSFGYEVTGLGDINNDGFDDIAVGAIGADGQQAGSGVVTAYCGHSGDLLFELKGKRKGDQFGNAMAAARLKSGNTLLAIGAPNSGPGNRGGVTVYTIKDAKPERLFEIGSLAKDVALGQMFIAFPGDLNKDGTPDVYVSDFQSAQKARGAGRVAVHSGTDGKQLLSILGNQPGEGLGTSPSDAGDVDGDGIGDLVIGAWQNRMGAKSGGKIYLYSSASRKLLRSWTSKHEGDTLGFDSVGIGDVDGDGHLDFLITAAWANVKGQKTGRVFIVAGEDFSQK